MRIMTAAIALLAATASVQAEELEESLEVAYETVGEEAYCDDAGAEVIAENEGVDDLSEESEEN